MNFDELKAFVRSNTYIKELWINEKGEYFLQNPQDKNFEHVTRSEFLTPSEAKKPKTKKELEAEEKAAALANKEADEAAILAKKEAEEAELEAEIAKEAEQTKP